MNFQELAVALGLLTPLILGIIASVEKFANRKNPEDDETEQEIVQGMPVAVDYVAELIAEYKADKTKAERERDEALMELRMVKAQLDAYRSLERR